MTKTMVKMDSELVRMAYAKTLSKLTESDSREK